MEREHLIIIALILVALYMMNNSSSSSTDKVQSIGPMGRIRYTTGGNMDGGCGLPGNPPCHIRTRREGFEPVQDTGNFGFGVVDGSHIRLSDKYIGGSQHIKNHIRSRNTNSMFSGMTTGCGSNTIETFRFTKEGCDPNDQANCY